MLSNCFIFAHLRHCALWREWKSIGGPKDRVPCILRRPSRLEPEFVGHWIVGWWIAETCTVEEVESFVPDDKSALPWWRLWAAILFRGHIKSGDRVSKH